MDTLYKIGEFRVIVEVTRTMRGERQLENRLYYVLDKNGAKVGVGRQNYTAAVGWAQRQHHAAIGYKPSVMPLNVSFFPYG